MNENKLKPWSLLLILGVVLFAGCIFKLPLQITESGDNVTIDVQTLGEYRTTVRRIKLINKKSGVTVWELDALSGNPQINRIRLKIGANPTIINSHGSGEYTLITPVNNDTFILEDNIEYKIIVWGENILSKVSGNFRLK